MNVLRFLLKVGQSALKFAFIGGLIGAFIGVVEGVVLGLMVVGTLTVFDVLTGAGGLQDGALFPFAALYGGLLGAVQGAACGAISGLIIGGRHWDDREQHALYFGLGVARKTAFLGGVSGGLTGMFLMKVFSQPGPSDAADQLFVGLASFVVGSIVGWCLCFIGGALWGGFCQSRPRSDTMPLDVLLRWLWGEKRGGNLEDNLP